MVLKIWRESEPSLHDWATWHLVNAASFFYEENGLTMFLKRFKKSLWILNCSWKQYFDDYRVNELGSHGLHFCSSTHGLSVNGKVVMSCEFHSFLSLSLRTSPLTSGKEKGEFESFTKPQVHLAFFLPPLKPLWINFYDINKCSCGKLINIPSFTRWVWCQKSTVWGFLDFFLFSLFVQLSDFPGHFLNLYVLTYSQV